MEQSDVLSELGKAIDKSQHKSLIYAGIELFSDFLEGNPVYLEKLNEPIKTSTKIYADSVEQDMLKHANTEDEARNAMTRYCGKHMKKMLLQCVGEDLTEEEEKQLKEDRKNCRIIINF